MISLFQDIFGSQASSTIVRFNDFSDFIDYFVQKVSKNVLINNNYTILRGKISD